jgi:hypothetical protein
MEEFDFSRSCTIDLVNLTSRETELAGEFLYELINSLTVQANITWPLCFCSSCSHNVHHPKHFGVSVEGILAAWWKAELLVLFDLGRVTSLIFRMEQTVVPTLQSCCKDKQEDA